MPGFDALRGGEGVAVHGVALPDDDVAACLDGADVRGQVLGDEAFAVAGDEGDFADFAAGVDDVEEGDEFGGEHGGADFDADGVFEAAEVFDVGAVELAGSVADPEEVGGGVVVAFFGAGVGGVRVAVTVCWETWEDMEGRFGGA